MQADREPTEAQVTALAAFVESLPAPPSIDVARGTHDPVAVDRGQKLFHSLRCDRCHAPPAYTTPKTYDVGLRDKQGNDHFNPPTLRGVGQRGPYFHDGRAGSLRDVFLNHAHQLERDLTPAELNDLVSFLRSL